MASDLKEEAENALVRDGVSEADRLYEFSADMRYLGQAYELGVHWGNIEITEQTVRDLVEKFHAEHLRRFAHADERDTVEIATLRLAAIGKMPRPQISDLHGAASDRPMMRVSRRVWFENGWINAPVYSREHLEIGSRITGPCIVEEAFTTLVIGNGWKAQMKAGGDLVAVKGEGND